MLGYVCFYNKQRIELSADHLLDAKLKAIAAFKVPKSKQYMVGVMLAEKDGETVVHSTSEL